ncbi:MAG: dephospho-CoA kinase [Ruminococcus sp.]|nr:dephospho-CoA kinase [Ruminococcus sp.]
MSIIVGLTGQSGAGKSTVCETFREEGFAIIDCDNVARQVTEAGSDCNRELAEHFPDCFDKSFTLDRAKMASIVFSDREKLALLERIEFKYITERIDVLIEELSKISDYILLDAPTLFEAGVDKLCKVIVAVVSDEELRLERIMKRDGISREQTLKRFYSQHDEAFFREHCDYVIDNDRDLSYACEQARKAARQIKGMFN